MQRQGRASKNSDEKDAGWYWQGKVAVVFCDQVSSELRHAGDFPVSVHVDVQGAGSLGQSRHQHHGAGGDNEKASARSRNCAVGDIGKRPAMNERGRAFGGLHEVREKGFVEQGHHRADNSKVCRADRLERRFA